MKVAVIQPPMVGAPTPEVSIFVPALDEQENIATLVEKIAAGCAQAAVSFEIVFVDDGSSDRTLDRMREASAHVEQMQILHHRRPLGLTQAMLSGFRHVRGDIIVFLPADLESDPQEDIPKLLGKMRDDELDVVCGWRLDRNDGKVFTSRIYNSVSSRLFPVEAHDMNWIKAFKRECLDDLQLRSDWHRFLVMIWAEQGFRIGEVQTTWHPRRAGRSKFGPARIIISFFDVLSLRFLLTFSRKPLLFFGSAGILIDLLGGSLIGYLAWLYLATGTQRRPLFFFAIGLLIIGFLLVCVGFLAELSVKPESAEPKGKRRPDVGGP
jgi:glycosyltransferase involved in cell wall biosynthesis